jgi:phenylalanyl-tRNA synthetase beta chain
MRAAISPGLLKNVAHNSRFGNSWGRLYEIGFSHSRGKDSGFKQESRIAFAVWGEAGAAAPDALWAAGAKPVPPVVELKGALERWFKRMQIGRVSWAAPEEGRWLPTFLHPGQCAIAMVEGKAVGFIGGLHPGLREELKIREATAVAELSLEKLFVGQPRAPRAKSISKFPAVERDVAFVTPKGLAAAAIEAEIRREAGALLLDARVFDVYEGAPLAEGERSVAFRLVFQDLDKTLEDGPVNEQRDRIVDACRRKFAITLR